MLGTSQYRAARKKPAPSHQPRTAASRADGAARMMRIPGTSPHQPRNSRLSWGKARIGSAPAPSAAYRRGWAKARQTAMTPIVGPSGRARTARPHP